MNGKARIVHPAPFQAALRHQLGGTRGLESERGALMPGEYAKYEALLEREDAT
jgi:hypothetical protein